LRQFWTFISIVIGLFGCSEPNVNKDNIIVLGHAGAGFPSINNHYPINSMESIQQALFVQGADGVEVDIQLTADAQFVLYHDNRLESGANDTGYISNKTWSELKLLSRRDSKTALHPAIGFSRLEDLLLFVDDLNLDIVLSLNLQNQYEIEDQDAYNLQIVKVLEEQFASFGGLRKVIVETRDHDCIVALKDLPNTWDINLYFIGELSEANLNRTGPFVTGFVTNYLDETKESVQRAKLLGYHIALYGVKIRQDISPAISLEPDYIQTDNVPLTLSTLGR
jgi:glycerophosphoryl diester phosphodiesterase